MVALGVGESARFSSSAQRLMIEVSAAYVSIGWLGTTTNIWSRSAFFSAAFFASFSLTLVLSLIRGFMAIEPAAGTGMFMSFKSLLISTLFV